MYLDPYVGPAQNNTDNNQTAPDNTLPSIPAVEVFDVMLVHGWGLWVTWGIFGFCQMALTRYLQQFYKLNLSLHMIMGITITLSTIFMALFAF